MDLNIILNKTIEIAKAASIIFLNNKFNVYEKDGITNIITTSDIAVQNYLIENLSKVIEGSEFYCEENDVHDHTNGYLWIIDPIDGTTNFSRGIYECAISIGLEYNKEIVMGLVYLPYTKDLYYAIKGCGAFYNGNKIHVSNRRFNDAIFCNALSQYNKDMAEYSFSVLHDIFFKANDFRRFGSAAAELCMLSMGKLELFYEIKLSPWDYAAASLIVVEAGGYISSLNKKPLDLDKPCLVIASNTKENFEEMHKIVSSHIPNQPY